VKLYLVDYGMVSNEYFYQVGLTDFGNFGTIKFDPPLSVRELVELAARQEKEMVARKTGSNGMKFPSLSNGSSSNGEICLLNTFLSMSRPLARCSASPFY